MRPYNKYCKPFILTTRDGPGNTIILSYHKTHSLAAKAFYRRRKSAPKLTLIVEYNYNTDTELSPELSGLVQVIKMAKSSRLIGNMQEASRLQKTVDAVYNRAVVRKEIGIVKLIEDEELRIL